MTLNIILRRLEQEQNRLRSEISQIENALSVLQGRTMLPKRKFSACDRSYPYRPKGAAGKVEERKKDGLKCLTETGVPASSLRASLHSGAA